MTNFLGLKSRGLAGTGCLTLWPVAMVDRTPPPKATEFAWEMAIFLRELTESRLTGMPLPEMADSSRLGVSKLTLGPVLALGDLKTMVLLVCRNILI